MKWATTIGRFAGIDVKIHATYLLLLAWVAFSHWRVEQSLAATLGGLAFILALFICVVFHEYGHALAARRYGIQIRDIIILLPIGAFSDPGNQRLLAQSVPQFSERKKCEK